MTAQTRDVATELRQIVWYVGLPVNEQAWGLLLTSARLELRLYPDCDVCLRCVQARPVHSYDQFGGPLCETCS